MNRFALALIFSIALSLSVCNSATAEVFALANGGRVVGELLNPSQSPRENYAIETSVGGRILLDASQVKQVVRLRPGELEYRKIRYGYADTAAEQWALAEWCREQNLLSRRKIHLERTIELDASHAAANRALGYHLEGGQWVLPADVMTAQGYVRYEGRWRSLQEIQLIKAKEDATAAQGQWSRKIRMWRKWLGTDRDGDARRNLLSIEDPHAVKPLETLLNDEEHTHLRLLYIDALSRINSPGAIRVLSLCSLNDAVDEVRLTCLDHLKTTGDPSVVDYYISQLGNKLNYMVQRAGIGLREMKDPRSIGPLIDALVTTHKFQVSQGGAGSISPTFGSGAGGGGGGLSIGGRPKIIQRDFQNRPVLEALVAMTGQNFQFQEHLWREWRAAQMRVEHVNLRRD